MSSFDQANELTKQFEFEFKSKKNDGDKKESKNSLTSSIVSKDPSPLRRRRHGEGEVRPHRTQNVQKWSTGLDILKAIADSDETTAVAAASEAFGAAIFAAVQAGEMPVGAGKPPN